MRFRFTGPAGDGTDPASSLSLGVSDIVADDYLAGHASPFVEIDFNNGAPAPEGQMGLWGGDALEDPSWDGDWMFIPTVQDVVTFTPGQWYELKYHVVPGIKHETKIWPSGDPEPDYQIVDTLDYRWGMQPDVAGSGPILGRYLWLDVHGIDGQAEIDDFEIDLALPEAADDFARTVPWGGWGTGQLGTWTTTHASHDQYLAVDGAHGVVDQIAPAAVGDITVGTNHEFVDPRLGPIELLYTFTQTGPATGGGGNPFIDNVFYVASDNDLSGLWSGVEIWNSPTSQAATWKVSIDDERIDSGSGGVYAEGLFNPTYGEPIMLRVRIDEFGTRARMWMAADAEPVAWTSQHLAATEVLTPWDADWIVLQPRQTGRTGSQVFMLDDVEVVVGSRNGN